MTFSTNGMSPDPAKIDALNFATAPTNKDVLISFLCLMQSNSDFILNFAQKPAKQTELIIDNKEFREKMKVIEAKLDGLKKEN